MEEKKAGRPKTKTLFLLAFIALTSCLVINGRQGIAQTEEHLIQFLVLSIHQEPRSAAPVVKLLSKSTGNGVLKKQGASGLRSGNYLMMYVYHNQQLYDSIRLEHPLYKHFEYLNAENQLSVKDTVLHKADFFVRFQITATVTEVRISETLRNAGTRQISTIKL